MQKGTHVSSTKDQLSDYEREILSKFFNFRGPLTVREFSELINEPDHTKPAKTLSILLGMDLVDVDNIHAESPRYSIPDGVFVNRVTYTIQRNTPGTTLWALFHPLEYYRQTGVSMGMELWPFRPIDRVVSDGEVIIYEGKARLSYKPPPGLNSLIGKKVRITVETIDETTQS